jgi:hypothetical protein
VMRVRCSQFESSAWLAPFGTHFYLSVSVKIISIQKVRFRMKKETEETDSLLLLVRDE